jgi:hypothetical protein
LEKASDDQSCFRLKQLIANDLKKYYEKNLTTKQSRVKLSYPDYLFIFKDTDQANTDELLEVLKKNNVIEFDKEQVQPGKSIEVR